MTTRDRRPRHAPIRTRRGRRPGASSAALALLLLAGCTSAAEPPPRSAPPAGPTSAATPAPGADVDGPRLVRTSSVGTGSPYVSSLAYADGTAAYAFATTADRSRADALGVWGTGRQEVRTVATTRFPAGTLGGVATDGESIVFVDVDRIGSTSAAERLSWAVRRVGVDGRGVEVLATSPPGGTVTAPVVHAGDGRFAWTTWEDPDDPFAGRRVLEWAVGYDAPRVVARGIRLNDSAIPVDGGFVHTRTGRSRPWPSGMYRTDLRFHPTDGSAEPLNLSDSGLVLGYAATPQGVVWTETHPRTRTTGTRSDPFVVRTRSLDGDGSTTELARGWSAGNVTGGDGWVAWWSSRLDLVVSSGPAATTRLQTSRTFVPVRPAGDADSVVIGESTPEGVRLTRVSVRP